MQTAKVAAIAGLGLLAISGTSAEARPWSGYVVDDVNERAGPSTVYPSVVLIPAWSPVVIFGCLEDSSWCDVSWGPERGWVAADYIQVTYNSRPVPLYDYIEPLGIPIIEFDFDTYWGDYYRERPFFGYSYRWRHTPHDHDMGPPPPHYGFRPPDNGIPEPAPYHRPYKQFAPRYDQGYPGQVGGTPPRDYDQPNPRGFHKQFNDNNPQAVAPVAPGEPPRHDAPRYDAPVGHHTDGQVPPGCHMDNGALVCPPR